MIQNYTTIEQSKKLLEIGIPAESADMNYSNWDKTTDKPFISAVHTNLVDYTPCWSLSALLELVPFPTLSHDKLGSGKTGWMVSAYPDNHRIDSCWHNSSIDACMDIICKLKEQNYI